MWPSDDAAELHWTFLQRWRTRLAVQVGLRPETKDYGRLLTGSFVRLLSAQDTQRMSSLPRLLARLTKTTDWDQD